MCVGSPCEVRIYVGDVEWSFGKFPGYEIGEEFAQPSGQDGVGGGEEIVDAPPVVAFERHHLEGLESAWRERGKVDPVHPRDVNMFMLIELPAGRKKRRPT